MAKAAEDKRSVFTEEEFNSPFYRWSQPKKRIKTIVVSTTTYSHASGFSIKKTMCDDARAVNGNAGESVDVDVSRMVNEYLQSDEHDVDYMYIIDKTKVEFLENIKGLHNDENLCNYDCFFLMFFTFLVEEKANEDGIIVTNEGLWFTDGALSIHQIWDRLKDIKQLHGKPKVILIQSDDLQIMYPDQLLPEKKPRKLPIDSDRLIIQSTIPGALASAPREGSFLIQAFLEVMAENKKRPPEKRLDLLSLTTEINGNVKMKINKSGQRIGTNLPYPQVNSTLTKLLYL